jgi:hypothetical protein
MVINDLVEMLQRVPPMIAGSWAAWLCVGLLLSVWGRRESKMLFAPAPSPRQKSGVRPPAGSPSARPAKRVLPSAGDAFGELEALLESPTGMHRMPGDSSPVLTNSAGAVAPVLAAPQSLP